MQTLTVRFTDWYFIIIKNFTDQFYRYFSWWNILRINFIVKITGKMFQPWKVSASLICKFYINKQRKKFQPTGNFQLKKWKISPAYTLNKYFRKGCNLGRYIIRIQMRLLHDFAPLCLTWASGVPSMGKL